jgi:hypothetical protein
MLRFLLRLSLIFADFQLKLVGCSGPVSPIFVSLHAMALAIVITLEKDLPDAAAVYAKAGSGKALARESDRLDTAARSCKVPALASLLSESQASLIAQLQADGFDPSKMRLPPERWFPAADGLKIVRALAEHVAANLNNFKQPNPILRDLKAAETLLSAADAAGVGFHFTKTNL